MSEGLDFGWGLAQTKYGKVYASVCVKPATHGKGRVWFRRFARAKSFPHSPLVQGSLS
jgi:hypothetical protein